MTPAAPARFSTTIGTPSCCDNFCPTTRLSRSAPPPGAAGTRSLIDRLGYSSAWTHPAMARLRHNAILAAYLAVRQSGIFDPLTARAVVQGAAPGVAGPKTDPTVGGRGGRVKLLFKLPQSNLCMASHARHSIP